MNTNDFVQAVKALAAKVTRYETGGSGANGACDCIGLVIGAVRALGGKWTGLHGSNYAARSEMQSLELLVTAAQLQVGELVYKSRVPGETGYALPARYSTGGDLRDYYHVGVVTSVNPLEITHCTTVSGGIKRDSTLGTWKHHGYLNGIETKEDTAMAETYRATARKLAIRQLASVSSKEVTRIDKGTLVTVTGEETNGFLPVTYGGLRGYIMAKYLEPVQETGGTLYEHVKRIDALLSQLREAVDDALKAGESDA